MPFMRSESCSFIWQPNVVTWNDFMRARRLVPVAGSTAHNPAESGSCLPVIGIREHAGGT
jgi:hypothetical protein